MASAAISTIAANRSMVYQHPGVTTPSSLIVTISHSMAATAFSTCSGVKVLEVAWWAGVESGSGMTSLPSLRAGMVRDAVAQVVVIQHPQLGYQTIRVRFLPIRTEAERQSLCVAF
jgi:hypothetical protein